MYKEKKEKGTLRFGININKIEPIKNARLPVNNAARLPFQGFDKGKEKVVCYCKSKNRKKKNVHGFEAETEGEKKRGNAS